MDYDGELLAATVRAMFAYLDAEEPWRRDGLCREPAYDAAQFFPGRGVSADAARTICSR